MPSTSARVVLEVFSHRRKQLIVLTFVLVPGAAEIENVQDAPDSAVSVGKGMDALEDERLQ
jgi:hypothetical protein